MEIYCEENNCGTKMKDIGFIRDQNTLDMNGDIGLILTNLYQCPECKTIQLISN